MAYTINLTDGTIFATIADGTINTSSSMTLVGKNYAGYGEFLDENFIHLLENGANTTAPGAPLTGQLFFNKTLGVMQVYNGVTFKSLGGATASAGAPTSNVPGDLWWDTTNQQLKVYNGTGWTLIGPASSSGQGQSGAIVATVPDNLAVDHVVVELFVGNTIVATVSKDTTFTTLPPVPGFTTISPGIQLSSTVAGAQFIGTVSNADSLDGLDSTAFMRTNTNTSTTGTLGVLNDTGLSVGVDSDARLSVTGNDVVFRNQTQDGNILVQINDGGVTTTVMNINGANSTVGVGGLVNLNANAVGNIGSSTGYFNRIFATSTTALYADVAERFHADEVYEPGTVVELGGSAEITISQSELSENVFGVISTKAAYLMNAGAGTDATHPPVAMTGRVPVRVIGSVRKGDRLVSAGNGLARAARREEITGLNVIGRSLQDKNDTDTGVIEAIVHIN